MLKIIIILMIFANVSNSTLVGDCNRCFSSNNVACLNETHFATCFDDKPTATHTKCPNNLFCTQDIFICHSASEGYTPVCYKDNCGECGVTKGRFTCINETTYGFCYGATTPANTTFRSCPPGYVCNYNSRNVCEPADKVEPSCGIKTITTETSTHATEPVDDNSISTTTRDSTTTDKTIETIENTTKISTTITPGIINTTETTTKRPTASPGKPRDADAICREFGKTGFHKSDDVTCRQYVYCYPLSGQYLGWFHNCNYYFNEVTNMCQVERPANCVPY